MAPRSDMSLSQRRVSVPAERAAKISDLIHSTLFQEIVTCRAGSAATMTKVQLPAQEDIGQQPANDDDDLPSPSHLILSLTTESSMLNV